MKYFNKTANIDRQDVITGVTGGLAVKAVGHSLNNRNPGNLYNNFNELTADYNKVKKGDVVLFQGSLADEKIHPVLVTENKGVKSKFVEITPDLNGSIVREGVLEDKLNYMSHSKGVFNKKKAVRYINGAYRDSGLDASKLDNTLKIVNENKNTYKYNPLSFNTCLNKGGKGTCVTFIDKMLRESSTLERNKTILPQNLVKNLSTVISPKRKLFSTPSLLLTAPLLIGASMLLRKDKSSNDKKIGATLLATSAVANAYKPVSSVVNLAAGHVSFMAGKAITKNRVVDDAKIRAIGGAVLGVPAVGATALITNK